MISYADDIQSALGPKHRTNRPKDLYVDAGWSPLKQDLNGFHHERKRRRCQNHNDDNREQRVSEKPARACKEGHVEILTRHAN